MVAHVGPACAWPLAGADQAMSLCAAPFLLPSRKCVLNGNAFSCKPHREGRRACQVVRPCSSGLGYVWHERRTICRWARWSARLGPVLAWDRGVPCATGRARRVPCGSVCFDCSRRRFAGASSNSVVDGCRFLQRDYRLCLVGCCRKGGMDGLSRQTALHLRVNFTPCRPVCTKTPH